jgi:hypothetical protein
MITSCSTDPGAPTAAGTVGGLTAAVVPAASHFLAFTVVLAPGP